VLGLGAALAVGVSFGRLYTTLEYSKYSNRGRSELKAPAPTALAKPPRPTPTTPARASTAITLFSTATAWAKPSRC
jgi:hypothetical protein